MKRSTKITATLSLVLVAAWVISASVFGSNIVSTVGGGGGGPNSTFATAMAILNR